MNKPMQCSLVFLGILVALGSVGCGGGGSTPQPVVSVPTASATANIASAATILISTAPVVLPPAPTVSGIPPIPNLDGEALTGLSSGTSPAIPVIPAIPPVASATQPTGTSTGVEVAIASGATASGAAVVPEDDTQPPVEPPDEIKDKIANHKAARELINAGSQLMNQGKFADAEVTYRKALEAEPMSLRANLGLAHALMAQGKADDAKQMYQRVRAIGQERAENVWKYWEKKHNRRYH